MFTGQGCLAMGVSSISAAFSDSKINHAPSPASPPAVASPVTAAATDTASISDAAFNAFERALNQVRGQINSYEHQVTWRLDHHSPVRGPNGIPESNGTVVTSATGGAQLVSRQAASALASAVSLQVVGASGSVELSFAAGTQLSAVANAVNALRTQTGVSATASGRDLKFNSVKSGAGQFVTVSAQFGSFDTVAGTPTGAIAQTVANGFTTLESTLPYPYAQLSQAQYAQVAKDYLQLNAEQARFQKFVAKRIVSDGVTKPSVVG